MIAKLIHTANFCEYEVAIGAEGGSRGLCLRRRFETHARHTNRSKPATSTATFPLGDLWVRNTLKVYPHKGYFYLQSLWHVRVKLEQV